MTNVARWVSVIAHPFVMTAVMVGTGTARSGRPRDVALNIGIVALFAVLPVAVLTVKQVRRGAWANVDASHPHERPILYAVGVAGVLALISYLFVTGLNLFCFAVLWWRSFFYSFARLLLIG